MKKEIISKLKKSFEDCANEADGIEFWFARDLQRLLDYDEWRNFINVIKKAKIACKNSGQSIEDHFVEVNKKVNLTVPDSIQLSQKKSDIVSTGQMLA